MMMFTSFAFLEMNEQRYHTPPLVGWSIVCAIQAGQSKRNAVCLDIVATKSLCLFSINKNHKIFAVQIAN